MPRLYYCSAGSIKSSLETLIETVWKIEFGQLEDPPIRFGGFGGLRTLDIWIVSTERYNRQVHVVLAGSIFTCMCRLNSTGLRQPEYAVDCTKCPGLTEWEMSYFINYSNITEMKSSQRLQNWKPRHQNRRKQHPSWRVGRLADASEVRWCDGRKCCSLIPLKITKRGDFPNSS